MTDRLTRLWTGDNKQLYTIGALPSSPSLWGVICERSAPPPPFSLCLGGVFSLFQPTCLSSPYNSCPPALRKPPFYPPCLRAPCSASYFMLQSFCVGCFTPTGAKIYRRFSCDLMLLFGERGWCEMSDHTTVHWFWTHWVRLVSFQQVWGHVDHVCVLPGPRDETLSCLCPPVHLYCLELITLRLERVCVRERGRFLPDNASPSCWSDGLHWTHMPPHV